MLLSQLIKTFESLWPIHTAEEWDRVGLMVGHPGSEVSSVLLTVDVTAEVIEEATEQNSQLILAHHPMLLRAIHELGELTLKGNLVTKAVRSEIAIYAAHTNADVATSGVSESLAKKLGLSNLSALDESSGMGVIGDVSETTLLDFARKIAKELPAVAQGIRAAGDPNRSIKRVALVAGAGDSYLPLAQHSGADVFITSDLRHHPAQDFMEQSKISSGPALIDISHWAAEWVWLDTAASQLSAIHPEVKFVVSDLRTDPWDFAVMQ
jgi:dinuclear metal center YbgI/SA1388 family protein